MKLLALFLFCLLLSGGVLYLGILIPSGIVFAIGSIMLAETLLGALGLAGLCLFAKFGDRKP